jgi:hypothetical protein
MEILIIMIVWVLLGWLTFTMAEARNREGVPWAVISVLIFPLGGIILLLLLGNYEKPKAYKLDPNGRWCLWEEPLKGKEKK